MDIDGPDPQLDTPREFKVHLPMRMHLRLHSHRLLNGTTISRTVQEALERYFAKHLPGEGNP